MASGLQLVVTRFAPERGEIDLAIRPDMLFHRIERDRAGMTRLVQRDRLRDIVDLMRISLLE